MTEDQLYTASVTPGIKNASRTTPVPESIEDHKEPPQQPGPYTFNPRDFEHHQQTEEAKREDFECETGAEEEASKTNISDKTAKTWQIEVAPIAGGNDNVSLADAFKHLRRGGIDKFSQAKDRKNRTQNEGKTKEELAQIRKQMMKSKRTSTAPGSAKRNRAKEEPALTIEQSIASIQHEEAASEVDKSEVLSDKEMKGNARFSQAARVDSEKSEQSRPVRPRESDNFSKGAEKRRAEFSVPPRLQQRLEQRVVRGGQAVVLSAEEKKSRRRGMRKFLE